MNPEKFSNALKKDPNDPAALRALAEAAHQQSKWAELADLLGKEAAVAENDLERADLLFRKAKTRKDHLNDAAGAVEDAKAAVASDPLNRAAVELSWKLFIETGAFADLADSLNAYATAVSAHDQNHAAAIQLVRADVLDNLLNDPAGAETACAIAIAAGYRSANTQPLLITLKQGRWEEALGFATALESTATHHEEKAAWTLLKIHLLECRLGRVDEADALLTELIASASPSETPPWFAPALLAKAELAASKASAAEVADALNRLVAVSETESNPPSPAWTAAQLFAAGNATLGSPDGDGAALEIFKGADIRDPGNARYLRAICRSLGNTGHEEKLTALKSIASAPSGEGLKSTLSLAIGDLLEKSLNRTGEAVEHYRTAFASADNAHSAESLAESLRRLGAWEELAKLRADQADKTSDDKLKAAFLLERAAILENRLNKPAEAADAYKKALALPPTALGIVRSLANCMADSGDAEGLVRAVMGEERLVQDTNYHIHLGLLAGDLWRRMNRDDEAFKSFSSVVQKDQKNLAALLGIEEICYAKKSHQNLYGVQKRVIESLDKSRDAAFYSAVLKDNAAVLIGPLGNEDAGLPLLNEALEIKPDDCDALRELRGLAYRGGRWEEYAALLHREIGASGRHHSLLSRAAEAAWGRLNNPAEAAALSKEASAGSRCVTSINLTMTLNAITDGWSEWLAGAAAIADLLDDLGRATLFQSMGTVHRRKLGSPILAAECYSKLVAIEPSNLAAREMLAGVYIEQGDAENLKAVHADFVSMAAAPAIKRGHLLALADLAYSTGAYAEADQAWKTAVEIDPSDLGSLRRLERLYADTNNVNGLIETIQKEISLRSDPRSRVLLLLRQGEAWESINGPREAITCNVEALKIDPTELDAMASLARIYRAESMWAELAEILDRFAKTTPMPANKIEMNVERAKVFEEKLNDLHGAIVGHVEALKVNPKYVPSLSELERLYLTTEQWEAELGILKRLLDLATDKAEQHRIHFKMGGLYEEKMSAPSAAIASFVSAHGIQADHLPTLDALERLYHQGGDATNLVPILEEKAALLPDERVRLFIWIGQLWDQSLNDSDKAIASYYRIIQIDNRNLDAIKALEELYEKTGQWENMIRAVMMKADAVSDTNEAVDILGRAGELWLEKFQDNDLALAAYQKALSLDPRHRPSLGRARDLFGVLDRWEDVFNLYAREIEFTTEPKAKADLFTKSGEVIENKIGNALRASQSYEQALRSDPHHMEAVRPLANIYFNNKKWEQAEPLFRKWVEAITPTDDQSTAAVVYYRRGKTLQNLSFDKEALEFFKRSSQANPEYLEPIRAKSELYEARKEWAEAAEAEKAALALIEKLGDKAGTGVSLRKIGTFYDKSGKLEEASRHYNRALELTGDDAPTLECMVRIFSEKALFNNVVAFYDRLTALLANKPEEAGIRFRKGVVLEEKVNDKGRALSEYSRALEVDPNLTEAIHRKVGILIKMFKWDEAASIASRLVELETEPAKKADAFVLMGRIEQDGRSNQPGAKSFYEKALGILPSHSGAMEALAGILEANDDWTGLIQAYDKFLKNIPAGALEKTRDVHFRMGEIYRDRLRNKDRAIIEFNNSLKSDADFEKAHSALAKMYIQDKAMFPMAVKENNLLLKSNAFNNEPLADLAKIFEDQKEMDKAFCVHSLLDVTGALGKWERTNYEARLPHLPANSAKKIDDETHDRGIIHAMARFPATTLIAGMGAALCKLMPSSHASGSPAPVNHVIRKKAAEIAANLELEAFEVILDDHAKPGVTWAGTAIPAFVINPSLYEAATERGKRFLVGRGIEGIKIGLPAIWGLNELEVKKRLQMIVKVFKSEVVVMDVPEKDAANIAKSLKKDVPRKVRKAIEDAAGHHHAQERQFTFDTWRAGLIHTANRGGVLVSAHPGESVTALLLMEERIKKGEQATQAALKASEQAAEIARFSVSDPHFLARKKTGFSLY